MPEQYVATNTSARSSIGETSDRSVLNIDGTRLHPERTYTFREFTSDILEQMVEGNLRVETEVGAPVTIETLKQDGWELKTKTVTKRTTNVDGRVDQSREHYYLEKAAEESDDTEETAGQESPSQAETSEESGNEESGNEESANEEPVGEDANEDAGAGEPDGSESSGENSVLDALKEKGAIPEDAESSSDVNAAPMAKILRSDIGSEIPESFFEDETRKTVLSEIE